MELNTQINQLQFPTLEAAWEGINEYLVNNQKQLEKKGGGTYGTELVSYDNFISVFKSQIRPDFDFGHALGYKYKKWSKLINNYVDLNYLDLVKSEVLAREKKKSKHYNFTFHFTNSHGSGKDCLISLSFCRRKGSTEPLVIYTTRASEATSRLIFDFLLIQRMVEYVYGVGVNAEVLCYIPFIFINVERFTMYMAYKGKDVVRPDKDGKYTQYQQRCLNIYEKFLTTNLDLIKYKVHKRSAAQVQLGPNGKPLANAPALLAKNLTLPFNKKYRDADIAKLNASITIK